jgi:hypothetical protein
MKEHIILRLRALGIALVKINSTTDLGELEEKITSEILKLDALFQQNDVLNEAYDQARLDLLDKYHTQDESIFFTKRAAVLRHARAFSVNDDA